MKGICFIEPLFYKVEDGSKTETRRIINPQPKDDRNWRVGTLLDSTSKEDNKHTGKNCYLIKDGYAIKEHDHRYFAPKYKVGDIVYLKEPYRISNINGIYGFIYQFSDARTKFTGNANDLEKLLIQQKKSKFGWWNKLFMPESAARLFIEILDVMEERLQDISEEDCIKEGITFHRSAGINWYENGIMIKRKDAPPQSGWPTAREAYAALIDHINGKGTWDSNPLVYVYEFKKYDRTWEYSQSRGW